MQPNNYVDERIFFSMFQQLDSGNIKFIVCCKDKIELKHSHFVVFCSAWKSMELEMPIFIQPFYSQIFDVENSLFVLCADAANPVAGVVYFSSLIGSQLLAIVIGFCVLESLAFCSANTHDFETQLAKAKVVWMVFR